AAGAEVGVVGRAAEVHRCPPGVPPPAEVGGRGVETVHAQVGGDAVGDLVPLAVAVGGVRQDVDEPRGDDVPGGVHDGPALQGTGADPGHPTAVHTHVDQAVEARVGVHHPPAADHDVE